MNKLLTERFQQLAGIKPLYEQDAQPLKKNYQNLPYTHEILLNDIDIETLKSSFPGYYQNEKFTRPQTGEPYYSDNISFPNPDDTMSRIGDPEISSRKMRGSIIYFCIFISILYIYNYDNKHVLCESKTKVKSDI